ncbi:phage tail assembly chaperone [Mesorhizobium sp. BR-1-1-10]|nr:phage tail assembly chaperone [Mesorhizobium sp. BR-1-1-10]
MTELPWAEIMSSALGVLKWTPNMFWGAGFYEYTAAMKGHLISQGIDLKPAMTREDFLDLKDEVNAAEKTKRLPNA